MKPHLVVLTGAGMSAESGLKTFRDADGLWEGHEVTEVATPQAFERNPELVLEFYNQRRRQLMDVSPNKAHKDLAELENDFDITIVTQNVDDLHERAGSSNVIHLHGELLKARSSGNDYDIKAWTNDIALGDTCEKGHQMRPHIVWFGEAVPMIEKAIQICTKADILVIIGTSMQVYPAASLIHYVPKHIEVFYIDPNPTMHSRGQLTFIPKTATQGLEDLKALLKQ
ncbi:NAD-dependent deacetylase [Psychroserpens sp. XS_ASV72]|uniref:SIR2 family NAD-dependent protein deacylase n=1 Tax=Psychroserpens sp. XS_ASV72 TaxID=3241293 RepID=UPI003515F229